MWSRFYVAPLALCFLACGTPSSTMPARTTAPAHASAPRDVGAPAADVAPLPNLAERKALFADLVAAVRKYHRFSDLTRRNLSRSWEDDLPALETAFVQATDEAALRDALARFGNSLHDGHLAYTPEESAGRGDRLTLPLTVEAEWIDGTARYYVSEVGDAALARTIRPGDIVRSIDGVPGEKLTTAHALRSHANNWRGIAADVAAYLSSRDTVSSATKPGDQERWVLHHRDGGDATVSVTWRKEPWPGEGDDGNRTEGDIVAIDYTPAHCSLDLPDRAYPDSYRLTSHGRFYCLYTSSAAPYDAYPILRHFSVLYSPVGKITVSPRYILPDTSWEVSAEYFSLSRALRALPHTKGLVLDLRDNIGGNDPEWFLDWYAPAPYTDLFTNVGIYPDYGDPLFRKRVENVDDAWLGWYRTAAAQLPAGSEIRRPFKCVNAACTGDNRFTPAHALVAAPIALLVGPQCMSACAHIAQIMDENDFAPLIGEPTAATYTSQRLLFPVKTRSGRDLGTIGLGLSGDSSGKTGEKLEGRAVHIDYPVETTFEGKARLDRALIDTALRAFGEFKFSKRTATLGP